MRPGFCPVCKRFGKIKDIDVELYQRGGPMREIWVPQPMYQRGYLTATDGIAGSGVIVTKSEGKFISLRCHKCYEKEVKKR